MLFRLRDQPVGNWGVPACDDALAPVRHDQLPRVGPDTIALKGALDGRLAVVTAGETP
jgi:hypothetical protein